MLLSRLTIPWLIHVSLTCLIWPHLILRYLSLSLSHLKISHLNLLHIILPSITFCHLHPHPTHHLTSYQGTVLSAKFDDASVALGAALLANLPTTAVSSDVLEGSVGLSTAELEAARKSEVEMQVGRCTALALHSKILNRHTYTIERYLELLHTSEWDLRGSSYVILLGEYYNDITALIYFSTSHLSSPSISSHLWPLFSLLHVQAADEDIKLLLAGRNELESYLLEIRAAPRRKHGKYQLAVRLEALHCDMWCIWCMMYTTSAE